MRKIKTKPFDLQKALNGAPVVTRDGRRVEIEAYRPKAHFCVIFKLQAPSAYLSVDINGKYFLSNESSYDLFLLDEETQEGGEK